MSSPVVDILRRLTEPSPRVRAADERRQARTLAGLFLGLAVAAVVSMGLQVLTDPSQLAQALRILPWMVLLPLGYAAARSRYQLAAVVMLVALPLVVTVLEVLADPEDVLLSMYLLVPVAIAGALLDGRKAALVAGVVLAMGFGLWAHSLPALGVPETVHVAVVFVFVLAVVMGTQAHQRAIEAERRRDLAAREALARRLLEASFGGLAVVRDGVIQEANEGFARLFASDRVVGHPVVDFLPDLRLDASTGSAPVEVSGRRADGTFVSVSMVSRPDSSPTGVEHVVAVQDLSERDAFQARLHQADRLAAMGHLAAGVAHEINNPLTWVIGNLDHLLAADLDGDLRRAVEQASDGARRVRRIARALAAFARAREGPTVGMDLARIARSAAALVRHDVEVGARLDEDYRPAPSIDADPTRVGQVCLNLLVNAAQAVEQGQGQRVTVEVGTTPAGQAFFAVADDGPGIPREIQGRVFDPFFSTKPDGTGLGLSISQALVGEMGGEMFLESAPGKGTRIGFRVPPGRLPLAPVADDDTAEVEQEPSGRARVLVVDDEPAICDLLKTALVDHDVTVAENGEEGRRRALERTWDVILCDLMMPGVSGMDIHAALAERAPGRQDRMVFLTGGAFTEDARAFLDRSSNPVMFKPFRLARVQEVVAQALAGGRLPPHAGA